jgi:predicted phosphodiesterase
MRVAALCDIHGNLPALEAVLEDVRRERVDQIVVGGDVLPGPMPRETLRCLQHVDLPVHFLYGNGEVAILEQMAGQDHPDVPDQYRPLMRWTAELLRPEYEPVLASWPMTVRLHVSGIGDVLFCHATPRNENEIFTRLTPEERLLPLFEPLNVALVVCGHTHMQFDRMVGRTRVINAGSVGMPFAAPGAYWALIGPGVELRRTPYDLSKAVERFEETKNIHAEEMVARYILKPPSEPEMLEVFTRAGL